MFILRNLVVMINCTVLHNCVFFILIQNLAHCVNTGIEAFLTRARLPDNLICLQYLAQFVFTYFQMQVVLRYNHLFSDYSVTIVLSKWHLGLVLRVPAVAASCNYIIAISNILCWLPTSKINGEAGRKLEVTIT